MLYTRHPVTPVLEAAVLAIVAGAKNLSLNDTVMMADRFLGFMRALQHPFVAWSSDVQCLVLCSTCFLKCLNDACLELLLAFVGAQVINVADLAYEEAGAVRVSSQEGCEY